MSTARLQLRHVTVSHGVDPSRFDGGSVFVASEDPPPVRTVLCLYEDDAEPRAVEVTKVIEVPESDEGVRGFFVQDVDAQKLELNAKVGTEHLESGEAPPPLQQDPSMQLGAPAPVMDPDDSIKIDSSERERLEESGESDDRSDPADAGSSGSESEDAASSGAEESGQSVTSEEPGGKASGEIGAESSKSEQPSRRRRRGRKKR